MSLSPAEIEQTAQFLARLEPGFLPKAIFYELARLTTTPILELVPLRKHAGKVQVLLTKRASSDPHWPGMLHTPGTVIRSTDQSFSTAIQRILAEELAGAKIAPPVFVESLLHSENRGAALAQIYYAEVLSEPATGTFYDVAALPVAIVDSQVDFIQKAAVAFERLA